MYESLGDEVPSSDLEYESGKSISRPDPMYCEFECTEYEEIKDNE